MNIHNIFKMSFFYLGLLFPLQAFSLNNPAAVYCTAMGYKYTTEKNEYGVAGICVFPDGKKADAWNFLLGKASIEKNYCARKGLKQKKALSTKNTEMCKKFRTDTCLICIDENGREVEVTELMGLNFKETTCGDGICGLPETSKTCPQDCTREGVHQE